MTQHGGGAPTWLQVALVEEIHQSGRAARIRMTDAQSGAERSEIRALSPGMASPAMPSSGAPSAATVLDRAMLLRRLAARVQNHQPDVGRDDAGEIPAGYTYLGQIAAHDITQPVDAVSKDGAGPRENSKPRSEPLRLQTLYGDGPDGSPMLYEIDGDHSGAILRGGRLRLGLTVGGDQQARDIPRLGCPFARDTIGAGAPAQIEEGWPILADADAHPRNSRTGGGATEPVLADVRNDDNLLVSQMLTIFIRLHNRIYDAAVEHGAPMAAYRRARAATVAMYRRILAEDLFPRLICPAIFERFRDAALARGIGAEFNHGAFRVCHSMVRSQYRRPDRAFADSVAEFLTRRCQERPRFLPIAPSWVIDWQMFFEGPNGEPAKNMSRKLGPSINMLLDRHRRKSALDSGGVPDQDPQISLVLQDYLRADELLTKTLPDLLAELDSGILEPKSLFADTGSAAKTIAGWLADDKGNRGAKGVAALSGDDIDALSRNAPLPFLLAFEAMYECKGLKLGPLGSALIARTIAPYLAEIDYAAIRDAERLIGLGFKATAGTGGMGTLVRFLEN